MTNSEFSFEKVSKEIHMSKGLVQALTDPPSAALSINWLGQAGFILRSGDGMVILIDPYLSDSLAAKYEGKLFPHLRLHKPPIQANQLPRIDYILITHEHTDHMDPGTLPILALEHPNARFIVPLRVLELAIERGVPSDRIIGAFGDDVIELTNELSVYAVPSAHEDLDFGTEGSRFLGYVIKYQGNSIYHSGDCVAYPGLIERLKILRPTLALLPVNGRDEYRLRNGVPGNMNLSEALELCEMSYIPQMIAHHWGLFSFNTISEDALKNELSSYTGPVNCHLPSLLTSFQIGS